jgi:hypothetical protein
LVVVDDWEIPEGPETHGNCVVTLDPAEMENMSGEPNPPPVTVTSTDAAPGFSIATPKWTVA